MKKMCITFSHEQNNKLTNTIEFIKNEKTLCIIDKEQNSKNKDMMVNCVTINTIALNQIAEVTYGNKQNTFKKEIKPFYILLDILFLAGGVIAISYKQYVVGIVAFVVFLLLGLLLIVQKPRKPEKEGKFEILNSNHQVLYSKDCVLKEETMLSITEEIFE